MSETKREKVESFLKELQKLADTYGFVIHHPLSIELGNSVRCFGSNIPASVPILLHVDLDIEIANAICSLS